MTRTRALAALSIAFASTALVACEDDIAHVTGPKGQEAFTRYVAIGTSVSMGWNAEGVLYSTQANSWPAQLANLARAADNFRIPFIQGPGCTPPLITPLQFGVRLNGRPIAGTGSLPDSDPANCAANFPSVTLPTATTRLGGVNVAIGFARAYDALFVTPESTLVKQFGNLNNPRLYARVLGARTTQVTAMMAQKPTLVSLELGANEILPVASGLVVPNATYTPLAAFQGSYDKIVDSIKASGAKQVVVAGLLDDIKKFPVFATGAEVAAESLVFNGFNITVQADCKTTNATNLLHTRGKIFATVFAASSSASKVPLSCADAAGTVDYVLGTQEQADIKTLIDSYNVYIKSKADANGWAYFKLGALYDNPGDPTFSLVTLLTNNLPYGPNIAADGTHPSKAGHTILAMAAAAALDQTYGFNLVP